jgi:hypothetical protein
MRTGLGLYRPHHPTGFVPTDIAGFKLWLDASNTATITEASGRVSQWDDGSGSGNHVVQATGGSQPLTGSDTQNSLNVITFSNARPDYMKTASGFTVADPGMVYVVAKSAMAAGAQGNVLDGFDSASNRWTVGNLITTDKVNLYDSTSEKQGTSAWGTTNYHIVTATFKTSQSTLRFDGASENLTASLGTMPDFSGINIGRWNGGFGHWNGYIAEILIYEGEHDAGQISDVETYLNAKWAVF